MASNDDDDDDKHAENHSDWHDMIMKSDKSTCGGEVGVVEFVMIPAAGAGAA